jgi:hypothetical protein
MKGRGQSGSFLGAGFSGAGFLGSSWLGTSSGTKVRNLSAGFAGALGFSGSA